MALITIIIILAILVILLFLLKTFKLVIKILIVLLILYLAITTFTKEKPKVLSQSQEDLKLECESDKGIWTLNKQGNYFCNLPLKDANKTCKGPEECEGLCIVRDNKSYCQEYRIKTGCFKVIDNETITEVCVE